jgi:hypothetical protein
MAARAPILTPLHSGRLGLGIRHRQERGRRDAHGGCSQEGKHRSARDRFRYDYFSHILPPLTSLIITNHALDMWLFGICRYIKAYRGPGTVILADRSAHQSR